ncbi:MAG TPA: hypothetical protein PLT20_06830 [Sedimentisphaerales bacterium]|nr:hypothetical protein [Sedimentisphaerales bacterium]
MQEFEALGYWFLPENPSREIPGTLRFSPSRGLALSLSGTFAPGDTLAEAFQSSSAQKHAIIHGVTNGSPYGKMFTLVDCFRSGMTLHMPGFATEEIHANSAYAGDCLLREGDLRFDKSRVNFSDLANWIRLTGIRADLPKGANEPYTFRVEYAKVGGVHATFAGCPLTIGLGHRLSFEDSKRSVVLRENVSILIADLGQLTIEEIERKYLSPLQDFFTLAADLPNARCEFVVFGQRLSRDGVIGPSAIHVLGEPIYVREEGETCRDEDKMLFTYDDVSGFFQSLLDRWLTFRERFASFCQLYFSAQYSRGAYVEERFLSAVRALTLLFRETMPAPPGIRHAIDEMREELARISGERRFGWVDDVVPMEAELAFPWSLSEVLTKYEGLLSGLITPDIEHFVNAIAATRRYVSCPDQSSRPNVLHGADLHWATEKLNVLIKICLLDWLEFPQDLIARLLNRNASFRHLRSVPCPRTG